MEAREEYNTKRDTENGGDLNGCLAERNAATWRLEGSLRRASVTCGLYLRSGSNPTPLHNPFGACLKLPQSRSGRNRRHHGPGLVAAERVEAVNSQIEPRPFHLAQQIGDFLR